MDDNLAHAKEKVALALCHLEQMFTVPMKLTFIARNPENDNADMVVTNDSLDALAEVISRSKKRERHS